MITYCVYDSPLGAILLESDGEALTGLGFRGTVRGAEVSKIPEKGADLPVFVAARAWLDRYFRGEDPGKTPPLKVRASAFGEKVYETALQIPYGRTATYGEIAREMEEERRASAGEERDGPGEGKSGRLSRAVGRALARNPILLMIPCHRVTGAGGALTGYAGGLARKKALLELEKTGRTVRGAKTACDRLLK